MTDRVPQPKLDKLIHRLSLLIGAATDTLEADPGQVAAWYDEIARQLRRYHLAAFMAGYGQTTKLPNGADKAVADDIATQLKFLGQFRTEMQDAAEWQAGWNARAQMYASSITVPYWRGAVKMLPLPAMPAQGTACLTRCRCAWDVQQLDGDNNYDAYWRLGSIETKHCQICLEREAQWSPVQIRGGELQ